MKRVKLSGSELSVSALCLGSLNFGTLLSEQLCFKQMDRFLDLGGNFIDTAHVYNDWIPGELSRSEKIIGRWLKASGKREKIVLATKGAHPTMDARTVMRVTPAAIVKDLNESLINLNTSYIDLLFLHRDDPAVPVAEIMGCLNELIKQGKVRYIGCSNWSLKRIIEAQEYAAANGLQGFICNQLMWSLARINQENLPDKYAVMDTPTYAYHSSAGLNAMCFSSQAKGYFTRRLNGEILPKDVLAVYSNPENDKIYTALLKLAKETGESLSVLALRYFIQQKFTAVPIVSCDNDEQLAECAKAFSLPDMKFDYHLDIFNNNF
ncbi:MAG: aldo/keto reductase [Treponemataceae bacterium]